ncbi:protein YgfX [Methylococcus capsulatus]|uniref:protein YgfX n=1 Tax=Methylococcus capsulatus TaxID=414 RepID=UPI002FD9F68F
MLIVEPASSRIQSLAVCAVGLLALAGIWGASMSLSVRLGLTLCLAGYLAFLRSQRRFGARLDGVGAWSVTTAGGEAFPAKLKGSGFSSPFCVVLHFSTAFGKVTVPVFRDSVDAETYRRLRVHLRCGAASHRGRKTGLLH